MQGRLRTVPKGRFEADSEKRAFMLKAVAHGDVESSVLGAGAEPLGKDSARSGSATLPLCRPPPSDVSRRDSKRPVSDRPRHLTDSLKVGCRHPAANASENYMPEIDFQPEKRTIEDLLLGAEYYVIPRFQRPYSWEASNLDDFWRDVVFDNGVGYFIGPMVAWHDQGSSIRRIVDGQQRLTTIAILFAVIRDQFAALGEKNLADGVHRYLEKRNRDNELQFTLQPEVPAPYLNEAIFRRSGDDPVEAVSEPEKALAGAYRQLGALVQEEVDKRQNPLDWLTELRDLLLGLRVIWVEHGNEDDAYIIFETLNSRGKDLEVVDLLKNHLLARIRSSGNPASDTARSKWEAMRQQLEASDGRRRIDANTFILHWWLSREDYVSRNKLFRDIRGSIKSKPKAKDALNGLQSDGSSTGLPLIPPLAPGRRRKNELSRSLAALETLWRGPASTPIALAYAYPSRGDETQSQGLQ